MKNRRENATEADLQFTFPEAEEALWAEWETFKTSFEAKIVRLLDPYDDHLK